MGKIYAINNNWYYKPSYQPDMMDMTIDQIKENFEVVNLPHTNLELPYNYFDEKLFQIETCYKHPLYLENSSKGKLAYIHFEGVMAYAKVYLNGTFVGEHKGGYTPFDVRIDEVYNFELEENILTVVVDSSERSDIPPFGGQIDYLTYGGIYREVSCNVFEDIYIKNIKIQTENVLEVKKDVNLKVFIHNEKQENSSIKLKVSISEKAGAEVFVKTFISNISSCNECLSFEIKQLENIKLWELEDPNLYEIRVKIETNCNNDEYFEVFGFRTAEFTNQGFKLNGIPTKIRGLNRHQAYPYVGYAMPKRVQEKDAEILKNDLHLNLVRTSHYPQSKHFLNKCDELGILVFEEIPGWQHIGNAEWKEVAKENVREMVQRDWNHPSIILWGVRINESPDDDAFYTDTNSIAHELDSTRQTGGVRCIDDSTLLEDVYTFNDFVHEGTKAPLRDQQEVTGLDHKVPYMVTEYNGHMYPTKRFDQEERQMEHALRHLRVQNASYLDNSISGAIGWCAFDYNTHNDFGSGDRICYHGVMDMFRIHKFAAYAYKSQVSPEVEPVLEPVTFWARGERAIGGIIPLVIFTNCDYIEFKYGNNDVKRIYPDKSTYAGVPYAPVIIDYRVIKVEEVGNWGMSWENTEITGYYNNKSVIVKKMSKNPLPTVLEITQDDEVLCSKEKDATRITVKMLDQCGNLLPFLDEIIKVQVEGPARIQGPSEFVVKGGCAAFWVETLNIPGKVTIKISSNILGSTTRNIEVI